MQHLERNYHEIMFCLLFQRINFFGKCYPEDILRNNLRTYSTLREKQRMHWFHNDVGECIFFEYVITIMP